MFQTIKTALFKYGGCKQNTEQLLLSRRLRSMLGNYAAVYLFISGNWHYSVLFPITTMLALFLGLRFTLVVRATYTATPCYAVLRRCRGRRRCAGVGHRRSTCCAVAQSWVLRTAWVPYGNMETSTPHSSKTSQVITMILCTFDYVGETNTFTKFSFNQPARWNIRKYTLNA